MLILSATPRSLAAKSLRFDHERETPGPDRPDLRPLVGHRPRRKRQERAKALPVPLHLWKGTSRLRRQPAPWGQHLLRAHRNRQTGRKAQGEEFRPARSNVVVCDLRENVPAPAVNQSKYLLAGMLGDVSTPSTYGVVQRVERGRKAPRQRGRRTNWQPEKWDSSRPEKSTEPERSTKSDGQDLAPAGPGRKHRNCSQSDGLGKNSR